ncbi:MAG TPA: endolytic transglycosylase MltG [Rhizomicrobium sp.]|nr:endolytic transglycosylase MltG [Rhizomicrobium sp.]
MRFLLVLVVLGIIAAGIVEWALAAWDAPGLPAVGGEKETVVLIPPGSRTRDIARDLEHKRVIKYPVLFQFDLALKRLLDPKTAKLKAGEYAIPSEASMASIARILGEGKSIQHKITVAEGLTSDMIVKLVQLDPVLTSDAGPVPDEGSLLPETYLFTRGETRSALLAQMAKAQEKFLDEKWPARAADAPFKSRREALILASIVEKESALPEERRHIAAVFLNRLRIGMKLQTDPTVIYGLTRGYSLGRGIRQSELDAATPYNTYVIAGLPPGPICNPGKDSIAAVLNPETSDDLFFVATGHGGHAFAATISEQARNVAAYRAFEKKQQQGPETRAVESNGRAEGTSVTVVDSSLPRLPPAHKKRARRR